MVKLNNSKKSQLGNIPKLSIRHTCNKVKIRSGGCIIKYQEMIIEVKLNILKMNYKKCLVANQAVFK